MKKDPKLIPEGLLCCTKTKTHLMDGAIKFDLKKCPYWRKITRRGAIEYYCAYLEKTNEELGEDLLVNCCKCCDINLVAGDE